MQCAAQIIKLFVQIRSHLIYNLLYILYIFRLQELQSLLAKERETRAQLEKEGLRTKMHKITFKTLEYLKKEPCNSKKKTILLLLSVLKREPRRGVAWEVRPCWEHKVACRFQVKSKLPKDMNKKQCKISNDMTVQTPDNARKNWLIWRRDRRS